MSARTLVHDLALLRLHAARGTSRWRTPPPFALTGAILEELRLRERIVIDEGLVRLRSKEKLGDELLDEVLERIARAVPPRKPQVWVRTLAYTTPRVRRRAIDALARAQLARVEERRILGVFPTRRVHLVADAEAAHVEGVVRAVAHGAAADERTLTLAALAHAAGVARGLFPEAEAWRAAKPRLESLLAARPVAEAVRRAMRQQRAAATGAARG